MVLAYTEYKIATYNDRRVNKCCDSHHVIEIILNNRQYEKSATITNRPKKLFLYLKIIVWFSTLLTFVNHIVMDFVILCTAKKKSMK